MIKRIIILLLIVFFFSAKSIFAEEKFPFLANIKSGGVNVRTGPNTSFEVVYKLNMNDKVIVRDKEYEWYRIDLPNGSKCFISSDFVALDRNSFGRVVGNRVNLRAEPNTTSNIMAQLNKGAKVKIVDSLKGWYKIEPTQNCYGWVHSKFIVFASYEIEPPKPKVVEPPKPEPIKQEEKFAFDATGKIKPIVCVFNCVGNHKLVGDNDRVICVLVGEKDKLKELINAKVRIRGDILDYPDVIYKFVAPKKIEAVK